jgi:HD-GYP domain-containing protein (c-di-GMP phosphodiesterase class II)/predicted MFS family arabinose efflux permease
MMPASRVFVPVSVFLAILASAAVLWGVNARASVADTTLFAATAVAVAWLAAYPLRISPSDDFPLLIVPVLVGLGVGRPIFPLAGGLLGLAIAASIEPDRWGTVRAVEEAIALAAGVLAAMLTETPRVPWGLGALIVAAVAYISIRTALVATRISHNEGMAWGRALLVVENGCGKSFVLSALVAAGTVVVTRVWLPDTKPLLLSAVPLLAAGVVLHIFHQNSMTGREMRRVLATTTVLADAMDVKDTLTGLHSQAVAQLSQRIARAVGVSERLASDAFLTGLLHDIGKVAVPDSILRKPGKLQADEWDVMRTHVLDSAAMVSSITGLARIAPFVRASHEHYDGSGYPDGLRGREIPLAARIVAIADAYHALTSDRVYRSRQETEAALQELERCAGTQFDPELIRALRSLVGRAVRPAPTWLTVLRRPAFGLLWIGELVSFLGDEVFFIAITLWVYSITRSAVILAAALSAGYVAQAVFSFLAGAIADRIDRRAVVALSDVGRALVVAALPFVLPKSLPLGLILLGLLNIGSVFFRAAVNALLPSIATTDDLPTVNALFQTTERVAEIVGGVIGAAAVIGLGYAGVMFADAGSFLVSATCVLLMPLAWGVGLGIRKGTSISADLVSGLRYLWETPFQRYFALLIVPGYLTLAFEALRAPMIVHTAHLPAVAYGAVQSTLGAGKLVTVVILAGLTRHWATPSLAVIAYLLAALGVAIFAATPLYWVLLLGTFIFAVGNMLSYVVNATLVMQITPQAILGRVLGNRLVLVQGTRVVGALALGRLADAASPPVALWAMATLSITGVLLVWFFTGRFVAAPPTTPLPAAVTGSVRPVVEPEPL